MRTTTSTRAGLTPCEKKIEAPKSALAPKKAKKGTKVKIK